MISGKVTSPAATIKYINTLKSSTLQAARMAVVKGTLAIHAEAIRVVSENDGGSPAIRRGKHVTVSDPFTPPHTDTGVLRKSIKFNMNSTGETGEVGSNLKYAAWLEFGTATMAPRPWLSVAVENMKDKIGSIFFNFIEKEIKK